MVFVYMLMLLFRIANEPWSIAAAEVKDLIPLVTLQPCAAANAEATTHIAGLLNYHGKYMPVTDVAQLIARQRAPAALSTRIAIVEREIIGGAMPQKQGLILDQAYEMADLESAVDLSVSSAFNSPYIAATLEGSDGIVQQLAIASLP